MSKNNGFPAAAALLVCAALVAAPGTAAAGGLVAPGVYEGVWHTDQVKVIIEKVSRDGAVCGVVHFDKGSRWPDAKFNFTGQIGPRDQLTLQREKEDCDQVAQAAAPRREGRYWVWRGAVTGAGLDQPYAFELRIPR